MKAKLTRLAGSLLIVGTVLLATSVIPASGSLLDDIRQQSAITCSYNFSPLPSNAGEGIMVAIVSQGITRSVKDVVGDRLSVASVLSDDTSPYESKDVGIGNGMVSLVAALAPGVKITNIKALDNMGSGSYESIKDGISRATELGAKIIILPISADKGDDSVTSAVNAALRKGILITASAGNNSGGHIGYPSNLDGVLAIGASNQERKVAVFSSIDTKVLYAPGQDVSAIADEGKLKPHTGTTYSAGVAGAICAILWSQNPSLSREQLVDFVTKNTRQIEDANGGRGKLIDGAAALRAINDAKAATETPK